MHIRKVTRDAEEEGSEDLLVAGGEGRERDGRTRGEREKKKEGIQHMGGPLL